MRTEFEKKVIELGFSYQCHTNGVYILSQNNDTNSIINAQFIDSEPNEEVIQGSNNGNKIEAIGSFKLKLLSRIKEPNFLFLAFPNTCNHSVEFIILPIKELIRRLVKKNRFAKTSHEISIVFWLMPDRYLYDCTGVGIEWEWYYLSRVKNGRMVDKTDWDYTEYLNNWNGLKKI